MCHLTHLVESFGPFKEVVFDIGEYTLKRSYDSPLVFSDILVCIVPMGEPSICGSTMFLSADGA